MNQIWIFMTEKMLQKNCHCLFNPEPSLWVKRLKVTGHPSSAEDVSGASGSTFYNLSCTGGAALYPSHNPWPLSYSDINNKLTHRLIICVSILYPCRLGFLIVLPVWTPSRLQQHDSLQLKDLPFPPPPWLMWVVFWRKSVLSGLVEGRSLPEQKRKHASCVRRGWTETNSTYTAWLEPLSKNALLLWKEASFFQRCWSSEWWLKGQQVTFGSWPGSAGSLWSYSGVNIYMKKVNIAAIHQPEQY